MLSSRSLLKTLHHSVRWTAAPLLVLSAGLVVPSSAAEQSAPATVQAPVVAPATPPAMPTREQMMASMYPCGMFKSVEQLPDGRVTFHLCAPSANEVIVTSSDVPAIPLRVGLPMTKDEKGLWSLTTATPVAADNYRYNFRVDGVRVVDPQATTYSEERAGNNGTFETTGPDGDFQAYSKDVPHGAVAVVEYWSNALGVKRRAHVYTPPGYMNGRRKYPVLYLVHGAGDSDDSWTSVGHANYILDNLIAAGKAKPMIVVMPFGHTPEREGVNMMANADFGDDFLRNLIPYVEKNFRTINKPPGRAMAGLSMGGAHTIQYGLPHSDLFRYIGVFSIGLMGNDQIAAYEAKNGAALDSGGKRFKLVRYYVGNEDFLFNSVAPTRALLEKHGIKVEYVESAGGHTWINWRRYLADFAPRLFK
jgi:enterochelin esterase family protein